MCFIFFPPSFHLFVFFGFLLDAFWCFFRVPRGTERLTHTHTHKAASPVMFFKTIIEFNISSLRKDLFINSCHVEWGKPDRFETMKCRLWSVWRNCRTAPDDNPISDVCIKCPSKCFTIKTRQELLTRALVVVAAESETLLVGFGVHRMVVSQWSRLRAFVRYLFAPLKMHLNVVLLFHRTGRSLLSFFFLSPSMSDFFLFGREPCAPTHTGWLAAARTRQEKKNWFRSTAMLIRTDSFMTKTGFSLLFAPSPKE